MLNTHSLFKKSFKNLNTFLLPVVIGFLLEPMIFSAFFEKSTRESFLGKIGLIILSIMRIYFFSGIYGSIIELNSTEEFVLAFSRFKKNAKKFWKLYFGLSLIPIFFHFIFHVFFPQLEVSHLLISTHTNILFMYILIRHIISKKYLQPLNLPWKKIHFTFSNFFVMTLLHVAQIFCYWLNAVDPIQYFYLYRLSLFCLNYFHFLTFFYLAHLILETYPEIKNSFKHDKEIYLINPNAEGVPIAIASLLWLHTYPALFIVLKALTPKYYKIREFNRAIWRNKYYQTNKLVAITCFSSNSPEAYKIAKEFKKCGSKVIMGGCHVSLFPYEALEYCHSVVIGDAEGVWEEIIYDYENNSLKKIYLGHITEETRLKVYQELRQAPPSIIRDCITTTRGCKFRCDFCAIHSLLGGKIWRRPIPEVVDLLKIVKQKYGAFVFLDNNIYTDPAYTKKLFEAIKPIKIKWAASSSIDIAKDTEVLRLAKEAGCFMLLIGYEISDDSIETSQGGKMALAQQYKELTKRIKKAGILVKGQFIFGFESDRFRSLFNLWRFCFSIYPFITAVSMLTPLPGSPLYKNLLKQNRLRNLSWRNYGLTSLVFSHRNMNNYILERSYPLILIFFFVTTSWGALIVIVLEYILYII